MIRVAIINESTVLTDAQISAVIPDLQKQVHDDFFPAWGIDAELQFVATGHVPPRGWWWIGIFDTSDQSDALGYHDITDEGLPLGKVFAKSDMDDGAKWTVTVSHELLEMLADPDINLSVFVQQTDARGTMYAYEVCDACEADRFAYQIGQTFVSDFVYPSWFESFRKAETQFDHRNHIRAPFELLDGGYIGYFDVASGSGWQQKQPRLQVAARTRPHVGSRRERRRTNRSQWQWSAPARRASLQRPVPAAAEIARIPVADLLPGDVLLYRGSGWLSRAIEFFDSSAVSHAALYLGDLRVGEAVARGVVDDPLIASTDGAEYVVVRRLAAHVDDFAPLMNRARSYLAQRERYAYEQLVLLAFLALSRKLPVTPVLHIVIRRILDAAADAINRLMVLGRKEPMICSEFVYRCFEEASGSPNPFALKLKDDYGVPLRRAGDSIRGTGVHRDSVLGRMNEEADSLSTPAEVDRTILAAESVPLETLVQQYLQEADRGSDQPLAVDDAMVRSTRRFAMNLQRALDREPGAGAPQIIRNLFETVKDFVTPGDLFHTLSLETRGQLEIIAPFGRADFREIIAEMTKRLDDAA